MLGAGHLPETVLLLVNVITLGYIWWAVGMDEAIDVFPLSLLDAPLLLQLGDSTCQSCSVFRDASFSERFQQTLNEKNVHSTVD